MGKIHVDRLETNIFILLGAYVARFLLDLVRLRQ